MIIAIDPGASGGIAIESADGVTVKNLPETERDIWDTLKELYQAGARVAFLEDIPKGGGMPFSGAVGVYGSFREVRMALCGIGFRYVCMTPQKWQKALSLGAKKDHGKRWKNHLKARAQALFPSLKVTLKTADALLILEAGKILSR